MTLVEQPLQTIKMNANEVQPDLSSNCGYLLDAGFFQTRTPKTANTKFSQENSSSPSRRYAICGVSDALFEVTGEVSEDEFASLGMTKGKSHPISKETRTNIETLLATKSLLSFAGGSPTNTLYGASNLGLRCAYIGCVGNDRQGYDYLQQLRQNKIDPFCSTKPGPSCVCYTLVTPDGQRSFGLDFGVTKQLSEGEIAPALIEDSLFLHFSAYELRGDTPMKKAMLAAVQVARNVGTKISIDLGDGWLMKETQSTLLDLFADKVSIIFANEIEADAFCEVERDDEGKPLNVLDLHQITDSPRIRYRSPENTLSPSPERITRPHSTEITKTQPKKGITEFASSPAPVCYRSGQPGQKCQCCESCNCETQCRYNGEQLPSEYLKLLKHCDILVIKRGSSGSIALRQSEMYECSAYRLSTIVDTNGAGDNFQAGFFYGLMRGMCLGMCLKMGNFYASKVIQVRGPQSQVRVEGLEYIA
ncbi:putative Adenosine kinase [Blattamonas nauphoetae]|uniref:Adenosine kinase n=1 Tax=Blattamonas nauphoetae TaxID=2049346 RepID=A0ABQ9XLY7_9EUKA|nr:putative Adenosine kinase [Blattamonas nauphoetae]